MMKHIEWLEKTRHTTRQWCNHWLLRYGFAVILVVVDTWLYQKLSEITGGQPPLFIWFYPATIIAAVIGGFGPGFLATLLSAASAIHFFIAPVKTLTVRNEADILAVIVFLLMGSGISLLARSVSQVRKRAGEALYQANAYNRSLLEASLDPLVTISPDGKVIDVNAATETATGWSRDALIGTEFVTYFTEPNKARVGYEQVFQTGSVRNYALEICHRDGHVTPVLYNASVYRDEVGKVLGIFAAARDVTAQKQAEEQLSRYKDHLEEEVQQRTADLVLALNAAEAANRAKSVFLSSMSHELRRPLNAILGFSSLMRQDSLLSEEQRGYLDIINRSGKHLLALINDVLEMAKIEAGRMQVESSPFDFGALVRDVSDMMHLRGQEKGLQLLVEQSSEFPRYIMGDEVRLRQVLINLIGNAVKFTQQGRITVRFGFAPQTLPERMLIEVEDTGVGISPEDQQLIFEPFILEKSFHLRKARKTRNKSRYCIDFFYLPFG